MPDGVTIARSTETFETFRNRSLVIDRVNMYNRMQTRAEITGTFEQF